MNIVFKYRMLSDESDNFVRDFEVYPDMTLAEFSRFLLKALHYDDCMISIFKSDAEWRPVEEFSEIDLGDDIPGAPRCMDNVTLMEVNNTIIIEIGIIINNKNGNNNKQNNMSITLLKKVW